MPKPGKGEQTRAAILSAAEADFAEFGYAGARIDGIAEHSGYNKTLIFRYFGNKLGLYAEVLKRIDQQVRGQMLPLLAPFLADESILSDAQQFKRLLCQGLTGFFDYLVAHPQVTRILVWEQASSWQTYSQLANLFEIEDQDQIEAFFARAQKAGIFRAGTEPLTLLLFAEQICWIFPTSLPFYQLVFPRQDFSLPNAVARSRDLVIQFLVSGILADG